MPDTPSGAFWVLSGPGGTARSSVRPATLAGGRIGLGRPIEVPVRARFAAHRGGVLYVVGDDGLAIVSRDGAQVDAAALPPGVWCHVAVVADRLVAVDYAAALVRVLRLDPDGAIGAVTDEVRLAGTGPHPGRQTGSHPHHVLALPHHDAIAVSDLGSDRLWLMRFDTGRDQLRVAGFVPMPAGSGPRHARATGPHSIAVACELSNSVVLIEHDPAATVTGGWAVVADIPISRTSAGSEASEIVVSPDARFAYAATRGDDQIAVINLERRERAALLGSAGTFPQHLALVGDALVVANQRSNSLAAFTPDPRLGLRLLATVAVSQPVCLL